MCEAGTYTDTVGAAQCLNCEDGKWSDRESSGCQICDSGSVANSEHTGCEPCPSSTFSVTGDPTCRNCEAGKWSSSGSSSCKICDSGEVPKSDKTGCTKCLPSTYSVTGDPSCSACNQPGQYSDSEGSPFCSYSPAGSYAISDRSSFETCPAGSISGFGQDDCVACELGKFTKGDDRIKCHFCDSNDGVIGSTTATTGSTSVNDCICPMGTYKMVEGIPYRECVNIPEGVNSTTTGMNRSNLFLQKGFYRVFEESLDILPCETTSACDGGRSTGDGLCSEGYTGKLCSVCKDNYATTGVGLTKECVLCTGSETVTFVLFWLFILGVVVGVLYYMYQQYQSETEERVSLREEDKTPMMIHFEKAKNFIAAISPVAKILISYSQIISSFSFVFDIKYPPLFSSLEKFFGSLANLDFIGFMPLDCIFKSNYDQQMLVYTLFPVILGVLILVASHTLGRSKFDHLVNFSNRLFSIFLLGTFTMLPSATLKIASTFACRTFDVDVGSPARWLKTDYSINCDDSSHVRYEAYAGVMIIVYPVGIPLLYIWLLVMARNDLDPVGQKKLVNTNAVRYKLPSIKGELPADGYVVGTQDVLSEAMNKLDAELVTLSEEEAMRCSIFLRSEREAKNPELKRLSFLYDNYEPSCWWFEIFETARRLTLTAGVSFLSSESASQIIFSMVLCLFSMRVYAEFKPFVDERLDRLSECMQWQTFFMMLAALALKINVDDESHDDKKWFDITLVILQFLGPMVVGVRVCLTSRDAVVEMKKLRNATRSGGGSFDILGSTKKNFHRYFSREEGGSGQGIEMGDVRARDNGSEGSSYSFGAAKKFISGLHRDENNPAPVIPRAVTAEEAANMPPPPIPTRFTDAFGEFYGDGRAGEERNKGEDGEGKKVGFV